MVPPLSKPPATRKRNRKRKRRVASSSESSSDSDSSSTGSLDVAPQPRALEPIANVADNTEDAENSSSSSDSSSDSEAEIQNLGHIPQLVQSSVEKDTRMRSPSPDPPLPGSIALPPFIPKTGHTEQDNTVEQALKEKFRRFWMTTIVDAFSDDLDELRKEQDMNPSRLALLIDSLASGADVFSSTAQPGTDDINEMEVVLDNGHPESSSV